MDLESKDLGKVVFVNKSMFHQDGPDEYFNIFLRGTPEEREILLPRIIHLEKIISFSQAGMNPTYLVANGDKSSVNIRPVPVKLSVSSPSSHLAGVHTRESNVSGYFHESGCRVKTEVSGSTVWYDIPYGFKEGAKPITLDELRESEQRSPLCTGEDLNEDWGPYGRHPFKKGGSGPHPFKKH